MWDRLAASIPAVTSKQAESPTTRAGFVQVRAGVGVAADAGAAVGVTAGVADGVVAAITLGEAAAGAAERVEACGLVVHAAIASDAPMMTTRTSGLVVIGKTPRRLSAIRPSRP